MKKNKSSSTKLKIILPVILLVSLTTLAGCSKTLQTLTVNQDIQMTQTEDTLSGDEQMMKITDAYVEFSPTVLAEAAKTRRVLFFYASWCPTCRPADKNFTENLAQIPADVTLIRVNYNDPDTDQDEKALAGKYGVTYQHTFVLIDEQGNEVTKWNGGQINELLSNLK